MKRRLFNIAFMVSLVLCVTTAALWVRSYWKSDAVIYFSPSGHHGVQWAGGVLIIGTDDAGQPRRGLKLDSWNSAGLNTNSFPWWRLGFGYERTVTTFATQGAIHARRLFVPLWSVVAAFAVLPLWRAVVFSRARRRKRLGGCPTCGYDLRATPDRCPECGAVPQATTNAAA